MKIQFLSDTHNSPYTLHPDADLVVHGGDFANAGLDGALQFIELCRQAEKPYVFVLGNHDYYHSSIEETYLRLDAMGASYLRAGKLFRFGRWTFVGGTLFSNFRFDSVSEKLSRRYREAAAEVVPDFRWIYADSRHSRLIDPEDYIRHYQKEWAYIEKGRNRDRVVVLTHFPPALVCTSPQYAHSDLNPYFINDIDNLNGFKYWLCGHTHTAVNVEQQGCRIIINPLGYPTEIGQNGYKDKMLLVLPD